MSDKIQELRDLTRTPVEIAIAGRTLALTPMTLRASLRAQEICEPMIAELAQIKSVPTATDGGSAATAGMPEVGQRKEQLPRMPEPPAADEADAVEIEANISITRLLMRHATRMFELACLMLGKAADAAWLETLAESDYERLLQALIEVNSGFFARRVLALLAAGAPTRPDGPLPTSATTSPEATPAATSPPPATP